VPRIGDENRQLVVLGLVSLVLLVVLLYSNILNAPFIFDDSITVSFNQTIRSFDSAFGNVASNRYIGRLTFAANFALGGLKPFGYHIVNVLIHAANTLLVFLFISLIFKTPALSETRLNVRFIAFSVAFLFAVHPLQTQAITYISQRFTSLMTSFYLLSIILYIKARLSGQQKEAPRAFASPGTYMLSLLIALMAMKTKEAAITLPLAIALSEIAFFPKDGKKAGRLLPLIPYFLAVLILPLSVFSITTFQSPELLIDKIDQATQDSRVPFSRGEYFITQFKVIVLYIRLLVFPVRQIFDYDYPVSTSFFSPDVLLSFLFLAAILMTGFVMLRKHRLMGFSVLWFFLTLSVESSVIPIRDIANEHRAYLPSIGFFLLMVSLFDSFVKNRASKISVLAIIVCVLSIMTYSRNSLWKEPELLWHDVIEKAPHNARAYGSLGIIYKKRSEYTKALGMLEKTKTLGKAYPEVFLHLGDIYYAQGDYEKALMHLTVADEIDLTAKIRLSVLNKLGRTHEKMGKIEHAVDSYIKAIELYPASTVPYNNLGVLYIRQGNYDAAIITLRRALRNRETDYLYKNLAEAYAKKGKPAQAEEVRGQLSEFLTRMQLQH
jgi:Flp pilus assembly protein TadD